MADDDIGSDPQPSTSAQATSTLAKDAASNATSTEQSQALEQELNDDKELSKVLTVEEFLLKSKTYMLEHEKHMFLDTLDADCLVVTAK